MQKNIHLFWLLCLICLFPGTHYAQDYSVDFRTGRQNFEANASKLNSMLQLNPQEIYGAKFYRFIQFNEIPTQIQRENLEAMGIDLLEYIPNNVYLAAIPTQFNFSLWADLGIRSIQSVGLIHKMDRRLDERPLPNWAMMGQEIRVHIAFYPNIAFGEAMEAFQKSGFGILEYDNSTNTIHSKVKMNQLEQLAQLPFVRFVDLPAHPGTPESDDGRNLHRSNMINVDYLGGRRYDGTGVAVAINDDGFAGPHIDFEGRANQQDVINDFTGTHGDMTVGIVGSAGNLDPLMRGMAPASYLHVRQYVSSLPNTVQLHVDSAVMVFSNSYSDGCNAGYTTTTRNVDLQIYGNPSLMQVFSAGNSNSTDCGYGAGTQWGNITGGHKMGKNVIATANLSETDAIISSSSRGPAHDGRLKPDIAAHGNSQMSNAPDNTYAPGGGTSAACPGIAGVMVQLHQAYRTLNSGANAPSALLKACLLNSANDLGNDGPDFIYGYGKVNAYKALTTLEDNRYFSGTVTQGATNNHSITIPANVRRARIMVYWHDKEASVSANRALINNLDASVTAPNATVHRPWVLNPAPNATTLALPATRGIDSLNNVEQVAIDNPAAGTYTLNVVGTAVPFGPQTYYVVYEFLTDDIMLTFPVGGEGLIPGSSDRIHWDAYGTSGTFNVQYSLNNGTTWTTINGSVAGTARFLTWTVPNTVTGQARVRITRGTSVDESDANFSIIRTPANIRVTAVCTTASTVRLVWDTVPGATGYDVFKLGQKFMDSVGTSVVNTFDVPVANINNTHWFSVRARGPNGLVGRRAIAIQLVGGAAGGGACLVDCGQNNDAGISAITSPTPILQSCLGNNFNVSITLSNVSSNAQTNFPVYYQLGNNTPVMQTYTGTLPANGTSNFTFTQQVNLPAPGIYNLKAWTALTNDGARCNDTLQMNINFSDPVSTIPYTENFQSGTFPPANSYLVNPDGDLTWQTATCTGVTGTSTTAMRINFFNYAATGQQDVFGLVSFDLRTAGAAQLKFDLAHARYSATYVDGLKVEVSTNCGQTFTQVYNKTGSALGTVPDQTAIFSPTAASNWRNEVIDLTPYVGNFVAVRFTSINGYGNDLFIDNINISTLNAPPTSAFTANTVSSCNGVVSFTDQSINSPSSWAWNFGDGSTSTAQNPTHTYTASGTYTVRLIATNPVGSDTLIKTNYINVNFPALPTTNTSVAGCVGSPTTLTASGSGTAWWYDNSNNLLFEGNSFTTPNLTGPMTYKVENVIASPSQFVGPVNATVVGAGGYFTGTQYLNFTTQAAMRLVSVWVDANTAGNRTILVYNNSNGGGTVVAQTTVNIPAGQSQVVLNLNIPAAGNYSIGGTNLDLFRNSAGANYPYTIPGLVSITGSSFSSAYYYHFYNWEVQQLPCRSASVTVNVSASQANFTHDANAAALAVNFTDQSTGASSWAWNFGDGNSSTSQSPSHTYAAMGQYTVTLTVNGVCVFSQVINVGAVSVALIDQSFDASVLPNPSSDKTQLSLKNALTEDMTVELVSVDGRVLETHILAAGRTLLNIDCTRLAPAMYFVRMKTSTITDTRKLVIKR